MAGAVAAAHPLAATAGARVLAAGGTAVDAVVAASAVVSVAMPHAAGLGGDLLALVRAPDGTVTAVTGAGAAPATAPEAWRPDGGSAVTVPGLVGAWEELHRRWGRLPLADLLGPAVHLAEEGTAVDPDLAAAVAAQRPRLERGGAAGWDLLRAGRGSRVRQPELARLLRDVGSGGAAALLAGRAAQHVAAAVRRHGGTLDGADLARHATPVGPPVTTAWEDGALHVQPPSSQAVLLAMAAAWLEREAPEARGAALEHLLVELTEAAFAHRDRSAEGSALLGEPLAPDPERAGRRGGPRGYLHTAGAAAADSGGHVVSALFSVFDDFGSAVFVPELGIVLNNRAAGFTIGPNAPRAGQRPVHTLAPALAAGRVGDVLALATPGADGQVQTLLQVLAGMRFGGRGLAEALAAPRWRSEAGRLLVEAGHAAAGNLAARGHDVVPRPAGDDVFGGVVAAGLDAGTPWAAADWRRHVWSAAV